MNDLNPPKAASSGPLRILIVAKGFTPDLGGIETYSEQLADAYLRRGCRVTVLTQFTGPAGFSRRGRMRIYNVGAGSQSRVALRMLSLVKNWGSRDHFDLIHCTTWRVALPVCAAGCRVPFVITIHGREVTATPHWTTPLMRWACAKANLIACISQTTQSMSLPRLPVLKERSIVSWNGIGFEKEASAVQRCPSRPLPTPVRVLCACRLAKRKNIGAAIRAVGALHAEGVPITLEITGSGPYRASLEQLVNELKLEGVVRFVGFVSRDELIKLHRECDVFLHPQITADGADFEGFCLAVADAMSFGLPTVVGSDGAPQEYVKNGVTGLVVDGNNQDAVTTAVRSLLDPLARDVVGRAAQEWALANLSWDRHLARILAALPLTSSKSSGTVVHEQILPRMDSPAKAHQELGSST